MFSYYQNVKNSETEVIISVENLLEILEQENEMIDKLRSGEAMPDIIKGKLPAFTPSGIFKGRRLKSNISILSGFVHSDIDKVPENKLPAIKKALSHSPYVYLAFISPSGNGLKVFGRCNELTPNNYSDVVAQWNAYIAQITGCDVDKKCTDISRLCFISYDPKYIINRNADDFEAVQVFGYDDTADEFSDNGSGIGEFTDRDLFKVYEYINSNVGFEFKEGSRNSYINKVVYRANRAGIPKDWLHRQLVDDFERADFTATEIGRVVRSVYVNLQNEHGKYRGNYFARVTGHKLNADVVDEKGRIDAGLLYTQVCDTAGVYGAYQENTLMFIKLHNRTIIEVVSKHKVSDYIKEVMQGMGKSHQETVSIMAKNIKYFNDDHIKTLIPRVALKPLRNTVEGVYFPFKENVVMVTGDKVTKLDYLNLPAHVWRNRILQTISDWEPSVERSMFEQFCENISGGNAAKFKYLQRIIGYLVSNVDVPANRRAVILTDFDGQGVPSGGTGKGILAKALSYCVNTVSYDGKALDLVNFKFNKNDIDTQLTVLQDTDKSFDFELLFSSITDGIEIRKMRQNAFTIPPEQGGKFLITTNYLPKGTGSSHERRQYIFVMDKHYNDTYTPYDEFGCNFFYDWDDEEWSRFYTFIFGCVQSFLNEPYFKNVAIDKELRFAREFGEAFTDFAKTLQMNVKYCTSDLADRYADFSGDKITAKGLMTMLKKYCQIEGIKITNTRSDKKRAIILTT
jgi:hypothetical protein